MDVAAVFHELYGRIPPLASHAVDGLSLDDLTTVPAPGANHIAWLVWHLTRVQDHHVGELVDDEQLWVTGGWAGRFGLDPDPANTGYGHTAREVASIRPDRSEVLLDYLDAVHERTGTYLGGLSAAELDRIVDRRWDPPITLGVRLVSIAGDGLQHVGQAAYVRGLLGR